MKLWIKIIAGAIPAAAILVLSILLIRCRRRRKRQQQLISPQTSLPQISETPVKPKFDTLQAGINKFHLSYKSGSSVRNSLRFHQLNNNHHHHTPALPPSSPFNWDEHPRLITEVVETGWPGFAFSASIPRASASPLWVFCPACDGGTQRDAAARGWDLPAGSSEFMQTVRLNPGPKKNSDDLSFSFVRTSLPLPGPVLGGGSFPQEAYFEITILYLQPRKKLQETASKRVKDGETDRSKLVKGNSINASAPIIFTPKEPTSSTEKRRSGDLAVCLGLINRASMSNQPLPGTFPGSIGFHSDGSVYLDGRKLIFESEKAEWADVNRVIGCGFAPRKKKVFFTVDSQLVHVIRCTSEAYSSPLYPVLAADADAMILVNLGQVPFKYAPANVTRMQNPSFLRLPSGARPTAGSIDSGELFSAPRLEADWTEHGKRSKNRNSYYSSSSKKSNGILDEGLEADSDLFEISLQR
ncbi:uncharacterized protein LOC110112744 [Dendrobium catenatum]|uniref:B30.2/SPRY domain-containing protein n=1 Tax=Dendrobium catenatum TaxID=906689 RepID=A0A2I0VIA1_9ASPA|nr:uncharacterized protein LOC110112744 [Dendrobium catenatum]PKU63103.1 hypothetical protein MA16_Dca025839 [Dendrobium catenatum]